MLKQYIKVMKALSDPNRVKIVKMLECGEMCVCEIQAALKVAQPTVSKHLKILEEVGLIVGRKDSMWVYYRLREAADSPYALHLLEVLKTWLNDDEEIKLIVQQTRALERRESSSRCR